MSLAELEATVTEREMRYWSWLAKTEDDERREKRRGAVEE